MASSSIRGYYDSEYEDSRCSSPSLSSIDTHGDGLQDVRGRPMLSIETCPSSTFYLCLDATPDHKLREVILNVAATNVRFQRALQRELTRSAAADATRYTLYTPPTTPTRTRTTRKQLAVAQCDDCDSIQSESSSNLRFKRYRAREPRPRRHTNPNTPEQFAVDLEKKRGGRTMSEGPRRSSQDVHRDKVWHPGHLQESAYEFVTRTPVGETYKTVRNIAMWSCCDEDECSPGCVRTIPARRVAPSPTPSKSSSKSSSSIPFPPTKRPNKPLPRLPSTPSLQSRSRRDSPAPQMRLSMGDPEDLATFAAHGETFSMLETTVEEESSHEDDSVYPDSDLEVLEEFPEEDSVFDPVCMESWNPLI